VYRLRADRESQQLINEKSTAPEWALCDINVYSDPRSRLYDPFNPDFPPKPEDDPASGALMERIYGPGGMRRWTKHGVTSTVANPMWEVLLPTYTELTPDGKVVLDLPTVNLLARLHSRDYQRNLEEVYLSALDVAFERFRFDVQFFGGNVTGFFSNGNEATATLGRTRQGGPRESQSILNTTSTLGFTRRFATGADLLVGIANSMVWQFSGDNTSFATSVIDVGFVQPLLRRGGKIVVLETLTRSERNLLANLRAQAQFNQDFYVNLAFGGDVAAQPQRIGGFEGGAGLTGFTGTGAGGFGGVGAGQGFGGLGTQGGVGGSGAGASTGLAGGGEGILQGFYGLLQRLQTIRNTELSLSQQELTLGLLEANFQAGVIDLVQVDEFRQNIETERANLLRSQTALQDAIEQFLVQEMSLPPTLPVELDDSYIRPFQLISPEVTTLQNEATSIVRAVGDLPESPSIADLRTILAELRGLIERARGVFNEVAREHGELKLGRDDRRARLRTARERIEYDESIEAVGQNLAILSSRLDRVEADAAQLAEQLAEGAERDAANLLSEIMRGMSGALQEIGLLEARVRMERIAVRPVEVSYDDALRIARANRLDWMNQRAALVDQWRLVAFNANRLLAGLDIVIDGDLGTVGNNPVRFRGSTHNLRARLAFDAPLNRKGERNLYRESLIDYQRAKRRYVRYVDLVTLQIRSRIRQIERLAENLEIQRRALAISIRRVDQTLEDLNRPFPAPAPGEAPAQLGPTAAQNLLRALSDLRNTQDNFMSVWLNYEAARVNLLFELGILQVAPDGTILETSIEEAMRGCVPIEPEEDERQIPVEKYLEELDATTAQGGDVAGAMEKDPEGALLQAVDAALWEDPAGERAKIAAEAAVDAPVAARGKASSEPRRGFAPSLLRKLGLVADPLGPLDDKGMYPAHLRRFRELSHRGLSVEEISKETGWSAAAVQAFQEAMQGANRPVVVQIPVAPAGRLAAAEARPAGRAEPVEKEESPAAENGSNPTPSGDRQGWIR
jgi:hypothetical protein